MNNIKKILSIGFLSLASLLSCNKFLDVKSNTKLVTPKTLQDMQALLDYDFKMNSSGISSTEASADNYFLSDQDYSGLAVNLKRLYVWEKDNVFPKIAHEWGVAYDRVFIANNVLDNIGIVNKTTLNEAEWNDIKAQALFARSYAFLEIALTWAQAYDPNTAANDLGIPLRLTSDVNEKISRSTLKQTYEKIIKDLSDAVAFARVTPVHPIRSSKPAIYALLARTYLAMRDYENCLVNANLCLQLKSDLLDFNENPPLNLTATLPFNHPALLYKNPEIIYASKMSGQGLAALSNNRAKIDPLLYQSFENNDLRRIVYFKDNGNQTFGFKGNLEGSANLFFNGIATDEVYLMRAECFARKGMIIEAMSDLNTLMRKRWDKNVPYPTFTASNSMDALNIILTERRKELIMRGLRWMDIKRLNKEGANISLTRRINNQTFTLPPNDIRFAMAIPEDVIAISGMPQNPRN